MNLVRKAVSSDRRRYRQDDFDLDLTYITDRILAMGYPATGVEGVFRNHIDDVTRFLEERHKDKYMIFNLSGRPYDNSKFHHHVLEFGWPDHHAPPLYMLFDISHSIQSWLDAHPENVVVIHCVAGKGRTGTVISAYLLYSRAVATSENALTYFARMRSERAIGVQYPSQHRYVQYFERALLESRDRPPQPEEVVLSRIVWHGGIPQFDKEKGGCHPIVHVMRAPIVVDAIESADTIFRSSWEARPAELDADGLVVFNVDRLCKGDILIRFFHCPSLTQTFGGTGPTSKMMFRVAFNTHFEQGQMLLRAKDVDLAHLEKNSKKFPPNFQLEIMLTTPQPDRDYSKDVVSERIKVKKEGFLWKEGEINTTFKRRWFLLNDNFMSYYRNKTDPKPAGSISIENAQVELVKNDARLRCFALTTPKRTYVISAENDEDLESWMSSIIRSKAVFGVHLTSSLTQLADIEDPSSFDDQELDGPSEDNPSLSRPVSTTDSNATRSFSARIPTSNSVPLIVRHVVVSGSGNTTTNGNNVSNASNASNQNNHNSSVGGRATESGGGESVLVEPRFASFSG